MAAVEFENSVINLTAANNINPLGFDVTISALLIGLGAEKYIEIFKKHNIGQCTLVELTDEDLEKLGVDDHEIRKKIIEEVQNLPIYEESSERQEITENVASINAKDVADILDESAQHLYRIYLSMLANTLTVKKSPNIQDCLLHNDKYASDIALATLAEINRTLNSMDIAMHTYKKVYGKEENKTSTKKIVVGTVGSATIVVLAFFFVRSLKQI